MNMYQGMKHLLGKIQNLGGMPLWYVCNKYVKYEVISIMRSPLTCLIEINSMQFFTMLNVASIYDQLIRLLISRGCLFTLLVHTPSPS